MKTDTSAIDGSTSLLTHIAARDILETPERLEQAPSAEKGVRVISFTPPGSDEAAEIRCRPDMVHIPDETCPGGFYAECLGVNILSATDTDQSELLLSKKDRQWLEDVILNRFENEFISSL